MQLMQRTRSELESEVSLKKPQAGLLFGLPFYLFRAINLHCRVFPARDSDARLSFLFKKNVMSSLRGKQISW